MSKKLSKKTYINNDSVLLEPRKYPSLNANLQAKGVKIDARSIDTRGSIIRTLVDSQKYFFDLLKKNDPTQIPFLTTSQGNILVNPSTISASTLQKIATNEIVAESLELNSAIVCNSLGEIYHEDKKIETFLREMYQSIDGGLNNIVEKINTADIFGFSVNYIRDYIDNKGYTKIERLDLLPPSTILFSATAQGNVEDIFMYIYTYPYANTQNLFSFPFNYNGLTDGFGGGANNGIDPWASYGNADFVWRTNILNTFGLIALDKTKCIHYVADNMIKIANPYGWNPLTRRVYDLVSLYDMYKQLQTSFLSNKACPLLIGYAKRDQVVDTESGNTISAIDGLYSSMQKMGFMGALVLSGLKDEIYHVEAIPAQGDTKSFEAAIDWYAKQIKECMGQVNIQDASYASSTTQAGFFNSGLENKKTRITRVLTHSLNRYVIERNFGKHIKDYGSFEHRTPTVDDKIKISKLFESENNGFYPNLLKKDNDFRRKLLSEPLLDDNEFAEIKKLAESGQLNSKSAKDNSNSSNSKETKEHYKHGSNAGV